MGHSTECVARLSYIPGGQGIDQMDFTESYKAFSMSGCFWLNPPADTYTSLVQGCKYSYYVCLARQELLPDQAVSPPQFS
jgi:hypothetical protein